VHSYRQWTGDPACITPVSSVRAKSPRLEGIATQGKLHRCTTGLDDEQVHSAAFCQNGQIMTAKALLDKNPNPTDAQIREG